MTLERPPLSPNTISLCRPWLPKNGETGTQGHYSIYIYCRLFSLEASSNSLRNLLEHSAPVALTAELDLITRALGILSRQPPSSCPLLTDSDPLITLLRERCCCLQTPPQA